jgi:hypothetical protein
MVISGPKGEAWKIISVLAFSVISFKLRQYYWVSDFYSTYKQSVMNNKNPQIFVYWCCECTPASPLGAVSVPRFA